MLLTLSNMNQENRTIENLTGKLTTLGQRIRQRREALKLTQQQLAEALGVTPQHISVIEQGKRSISVEGLAKLAEELGVSIDYLVTGKEVAVADVIPAIKADESLELEVKNALVTLVKALKKQE